MAKENAAVAAYENPLIPNARLRQLYRAMLRTRLLARALPGGRGSSVPGREACLVSTSVDLGQGDLVSDALTGPVMEFLRGAGLATVVRGEKASSKRGVSTDCAAAVQLPFAGGSAERIWLALGAAATLKAQAARARIEHQATDAEKTSQSVVVLYTLPGSWLQRFGARLWRWQWNRFFR